MHTNGLTQVVGPVQPVPDRQIISIIWKTSWSDTNHRIEPSVQQQVR